MIKKLFAIGLAAAALHQGAFAQDTIKLGIVNIDSGPFTNQAMLIKDGATFAVEQLNAQGGALGRKYELVIQNHTGTPAAAIAAASRLVDQQGVSFFAGLNGSATALAIASKVAGQNALFLDTTASTDELTGKNCQPNYFRVGVNDATTINGFRELIKESGVKNWDILAADYAAGHSLARNFTTLVKETGGTVQQTLFAPLTSPDMGSYISQLMAKPADGLLVFFPGSPGIALSKQQQAFGMYGKYRSVLSASTTNETYIDAQGDSTAGMYSTQTYLASMPGEANAAFVKAYEARYKRKPTYIDVDTILSFQLIDAAIKKAKSTDVPAVRNALAGIKVPSVVGEVEMRAADHQALRPLFIVQATKVGEGKGEIKLKSVLPTAKIAPVVSPECKMAAS